MKYRVLIVDDEADSRDALAELSQRWGYDVQTASDGTEALRRAIEWHPDVILTDLVMPNMDGLWLLRALRAELPDCPVVLLTGRGTIQTRGAGHPRGRLRLHREAARGAPAQDRAGAGAREEGDHARGAAPAAAPRRAGPRRRRDRLGAGHAEGLRAGEEGLPVHRERGHQRRERHRQGGGGARHPQPVPAQGQALHRPQLLGHPGHPHRVRAVRLRARRLHRRRAAPARKLRDGARRHALPGRDRRPPPRAAGQVPAGAGGAEDPPAGRPRRGRGGRARASAPPTAT